MQNDTKATEDNTVRQLREFAIDHEWLYDRVEIIATLHKAADEIERLRKERVNLLGRIRRIACAHKDIGLPGCTVCDPLWEQHVDVSLGASI